MELIEKYRLSLLQLKQYSDNELIIIEGNTLNINDELESLKKTWNYSLSSESIWSNFDCGQVKADTYEEAEELAKKELKIELDQCNKFLQGSGFEISMDFTNIEINLEK